MIAPNVLSIAIIVAVMALADGFAEQIPTLGQPWVPFAVVALGALVKGLQIILADLRAREMGMTAVQSRLWRLLAG
jgi:hypothetical protein